VSHRPSIGCTPNMAVVPGVSAAPLTNVASPAPASVTSDGATLQTRPSVVVRSASSVHSSAFIPPMRIARWLLDSAAGTFSNGRTTRSGCAYGSGRSSTAFTTLKIAVVAPMPRASVRIAAAANPGAPRNVRTAYRRSWLSASSIAEPGDLSRSEVDRDRHQHFDRHAVEQRLAEFPLPHRIDRGRLEVRMRRRARADLADGS